MKYLLFLMIFSGGLYGLSTQYGLMINVSDSLPHVLYLVKKEETVSLRKGDYVVFQSRFQEAPLTKQITGVPGDQIRSVSRTILINYEKVGVAHYRRSNGDPLKVIQNQTIPQGQYFVSGRHGKSFDSRYAEFGLVSQSKIFGKAVPLC